MSSATWTFTQIPFEPGLPWFSRPITLQGVGYVLEFQWNAREQRWFMDIQDSSEQPLLQGIALDIKRDCSSQYGSYVFPQGFFYCLDTSGADESPTLNSFQQNHQLIFVDETT